MALGTLGGAVLALSVAAALGIDLSEVRISALVVLALLVADPVASASTPPGRWLYGAVYGGLVAAFAVVWTNAAPVQLVVSAALLASLSAPLPDELAIAIWLWEQPSSSLG